MGFHQRMSYMRTPLRPFQLPELCDGIPPLIHSNFDALLPGDCNLDAAQELFLVVRLHQEIEVEGRLHVTIELQYISHGKWHWIYCSLYIDRSLYVFITVLFSQTKTNMQMHMVSWSKLTSQYKSASLSRSPFCHSDFNISGASNFTRFWCGRTQRMILAFAARRSLSCTKMNDAA